MDPGLRRRQRLHSRPRPGDRAARRGTAVHRPGARLARTAARCLEFPDDPLIAGFDLAGRSGMFNLPASRSEGGETGGARRDTGRSGAWNVIAFRRGLDARSIPPIRISGEATRDRSVMLAKLTEILS